MKSALVSLVALVAVFGASSPANAKEAGGCLRSCSTTSLRSVDNGFFAHLGVSRIGVRVAAPSVVNQYDYQPACEGICKGGLAGAQAACKGAEQAVLVAVTQVGTNNPRTVQDNPVCLTPAEQLAFDPAQLQAMVDDYFQRIPLPTPGLRVSPADNAVVNLPEIVSADAPGATTFTVNEAPFPKVTIKATVRWEWDFGDGATLATANPGRAYDINDPDTSHYVTHTYKTARQGWPLTVTSVWTATYTVAGMPGTNAVTGAVRRTTTRSLPAADYASTLTGN